MTVKYMHVRQIEWDTNKEDFVISPRGGVTIAYTVDEVQKFVMCTFVKCKNTSTTSEYLLAKQEDAKRTTLIDYRDGIINVDQLEKKLRKIAGMRTTEQELFCYAKGRELARAKLQAPQGGFDILDLQHPISEQLADWLATDVWPTGPEAVGYSGNDMGFAIEILKDDKGRWVSEFTESMDTDPVVFEADEQTVVENQTAYVPESQEFLHP